MFHSYVSTLESDVQKDKDTIVNRNHGTSCAQVGDIIQDATVACANEISQQSSDKKRCSGDS